MTTRPDSTHVIPRRPDDEPCRKIEYRADTTTIRASSLSRLNICKDALEQGEVRRGPGPRPLGWQSMRGGAKDDVKKESHSTDWDDLTIPYLQYSNVSARVDGHRHGIASHTSVTRLRSYLERRSDIGPRPARLLNVGLLTAGGALLGVRVDCCHDRGAETMALRLWH